MHIDRVAIATAVEQDAEAIGDLQKLVEQQPESAEDDYFLAWLYATAAHDLRDPARALNLARRAIKLAPENASYWTTLGLARYRAGDWKGALAALSRSMELRHGQSDSINYFFRAMAHWQIGEKEKARKWYDRAVLWMEINMQALQKLAPFHPDESRRIRAEAAELVESKSVLNMRGPD